MKFTINSKQLSMLIKDVVSVVPSASTLPILSNILISVEKDGIKFRSTSLDIDLVVKNNEVVSQDTELGTACVPAKKFMEVISGITGDITISSTNTKKLSKINIEYKNGKATLNCMDEDEFPPMWSSSSNISVSLPGTLLKKIYSMVESETSSDSSRQILEGIHLKYSVDDGLVAEATNGFALCRASVPGVRQKDKDTPFSIIVPKKFFGILGNITEIVNISIDENSIIYSDSWRTQRSSLVQGKYPDINSVIPKSSNFTIEINPQELINSLKHAIVLAKESSGIVGILFGENTIEISSNVQEIGVMSESVDCKYDKPHSFDEIHLNSDMLIKLITPIKNSNVLKLGFTTPSSPIKLTTDTQDWLGVLMPMHKM